MHALHEEVIQGFIGCITTYLVLKASHIIKQNIFTVALKLVWQME